MALLFVTLWKYELASKHATFRLRALKRKLAGDEELWAPNPRRSAAPHALMPALPLDEAGKYVAAAYLVFLALILIYVAIMAGRLSRIERDLGEVSDAARAARRRRGGRAGDGRAVSELLGARRVAQDGAAGRARAAGAARRAGRAVPAGAGRASGRVRGRRGLDLQPHRALRRRGDPDAASPPCWSCWRARAGSAARRRRLRLAQLRRRAAPVPRRQRAGVDDRRRGRDPGPGQARLRARAGRAHDRADDQQALPRRAGDRQARAHGDRDLDRARVRGLGRRRRRAGRASATWRRATS